MESSTRESGFTVIEVSVAAGLVVAFALAFATTFGVAFGATRGNLLRQQATAVVNEEFEYVRALAWSELAMTAVTSTAPMLNDAATRLEGADVGFDGEETLVVIPSAGFVTPWRTYWIDGQQYLVWRYVTHAGGGLRRFVVFVQWNEDGASETLIGSTLVSEVTARTNSGGVGTTAPETPPTSVTTSTTTTTTTVPPTTTTSTTTTTTTTVPVGIPMVLTQLTLDLNRPANKQTATVAVRTASLLAVSGATVYGTWSTTPAQVGYPLSVQQTTNGSGSATFTHNDGHPTGAIVQFCVTNIVKTGYTYTGGTQCVTATW